MRRDIVSRKVCEFSNRADIVLVGSASIAEEVADLYRPGYFYIMDNYGLSLPIGLGLAIGTDKRVFVLTGEGDLLRNFGIIHQIASIKKQNLFIFIFNDGCYQSAGGFPNVFNDAQSVTSMFFNIGCKVFNLTADFKNKRYKIMHHFLDRSRGPMVCLFDVEKSKSFDTVPQNNLKEFIGFVRDDSIHTALFNPFAEGFLSGENLNDDAIPILRM